MSKNNAAVENGAQKASVPNPLKAGEFIGEVKGELKRIHWTSKEELKVYTRIVVIATFMLGMSIYVVDLLLRSSLAGLSAIMRLITG